MAVLQQFLLSLIPVVIIAFDLYIKVVFAAIVLSWLESFGIVNSYNKIVRVISDVIHSLTDWYFGFFRRFISPVGIVDVSSLLALFVLYFAAQFIPRVLYVLAQSL